MSGEPHLKRGTASTRHGRRGSPLAPLLTRLPRASLPPSCSYNSYPLGAPPNPFDRPEHYHDCAICEPEGCAVPEQNASLEQRWACRFSWLPDLNQDHPYVRNQSAAWIDW